MPLWWNWQTRQTQNLLLFERGGSNPPGGTKRLYKELEMAYVFVHDYDGSPFVIPEIRKDKWELYVSQSISYYEFEFDENEDPPDLPRWARPVDSFESVSFDFPKTNRP